MPKNYFEALQAIAELDGWKVRPALREFLKTVKVEETEVKGKPKRTQTQSDSLFMWFGQIEKLAENEGLTWDMLIRHIHQLRITKNGLHMLCLELIEPLFGIKSTRKLEKMGHIDIVIDHFVDLFSKEGLELPPFPHKEKKEVSAIESMNKGYEYPTEDAPADKF